MTDTPLPGTPAYVAAGVALLAKTAHVWMSPALINVTAETRTAAIFVNDHRAGARIARLLGIATTATFDDVSTPGLIHIRRSSVIEGIELAVSSQGADPRGEVAA